MPLCVIGPDLALVLPTGCGLDGHNQTATAMHAPARPVAASETSGGQRPLPRRLTLSSSGGAKDCTVGTCPRTKQVLLLAWRSTCAGSDSRKLALASLSDKCPRGGGMILRHLERRQETQCELTLRGECVLTRPWPADQSQLKPNWPRMSIS